MSPSTKDDEIDCVVLVSMIRSYPIMSIIVADKILFADINANQMYGVANELNLDSVTGWHSVFLADDSMIYMFRQCLWLSMNLTYRRPPRHAERMHQRIQARQRPPLLPVIIRTNPVGMTPTNRKDQDP